MSDFITQKKIGRRDIKAFSTDHPSNKLLGDIDDPSEFLYIINVRVILDNSNSQRENGKELNGRKPLSIPPKKSKQSDKRNSKFHYSQRSPKIFGSEMKVRNKKLNDFLKKKWVDLSKETNGTTRTKKSIIIYKQSPKVMELKGVKKSKKNPKKQKTKKKKHSEIFYSKYKKQFNSKILKPKSGKNKEARRFSSLKMKSIVLGGQKFSRLRREKFESI